MDVNVAILEEEFPHKAGLQSWVAIFPERISEYLVLISRFLSRVPVELPHATDNQSPKSDEYTGTTLSSPYKRQLERLQKDHSDLIQSSSRASRRLDGLEHMLRDDELRHTALLYYQLNNLWTFCHRQLAIHKKQLIRLFEEEERIKLLEEYKVQQEKESQTVAQQFSQLDKSRQQLEFKKRTLIQKINARKQFWYFFVRKVLKRELDKIKMEIAPIEKGLIANKIDRVRLEVKQAPKLKGLSLDGRRAVNNHLIAYAQFYFVYFSQNNLATLALSARDSSPGDLFFGTHEKCQKLELSINDKKDEINKISGFKKAVARQARRVASQARYESVGVAVPATYSLGFALRTRTFEPDQLEDSETEAELTNVVKDSYWDIDQLFLR